MALQLVTPETPAPDDEGAAKLRSALEILDMLRADIASGKLKAFVAIGITDDHETYRYQSHVRSTTKLEMLGAASTIVAAIRED